MWNIQYAKKLRHRPNMRNVKSERLKKLEQELTDLEQWLKLGLVPKKDIERHKEEIEAIKAKIDEEKERLHFMKTSGEDEDYSGPKRPQSRTTYTEMPTIPDIDVAETGAGVHETSYEATYDNTESDQTSIDEKDEEEDITVLDEDDESIFSDKNRWRRGAREIRDPDEIEW